MYMKQTILFSAFLVLLLATAAFAATDEEGDLEIDDVDAYINDNFQSDVDEDGGDFDPVKVGDNITIRVTIKNTFERMDLDDNFVEINVDNLKGPTDDLIIKSEEVDNLDDGEDHEFTFTFQIPSNAPDGSHRIRITARGEDEDNDDVKSSVSVDMVVIKPAHSLIISDIVPSKSIVKCGETLSLEANLVNEGRNEETGTITFEAFGEQKTSSFRVYSGYKTVKKSTFEVPETKVIGDHLVKVSAEYAGETVEATKTINVGQCSFSLSQQDTANNAVAPSDSTTVNTITTVSPTGDAITTRYSVKTRDSGLDPLVTILIVLLVILCGTTLFAVLAGRE